jgi:hypothetical protein
LEERNEMAVTKYNLYDSGSSTNCNALCLAFLRAALIPDWLGENGTVEPKSGQANMYVLTDGDGDKIAELNNPAGNGSLGNTMFYIDSGHSISYANSSSTRFVTGYKTSKGAMIIMNNSDYGNGCGILVFGKTNNGKLAMVLKSPSGVYKSTGGYTGYAATAYGAFVGARDDDISALGHGVSFGPMSSEYGSALSFNENQTVLCPTPTHSNPGETSIIEGVFMMPWSQYRNEGILQINLKRYVTNGYWALED